MTRTAQWHFKVRGGVKSVRSSTASKVGGPGLWSYMLGFE